MNKILIAGATGYLGSYIASELKKQNYFVRVLARNPEKLRKTNRDLDEVFEAEITKPETLVNCCEEIDVVITTIGITHQKDGLTYMNVDYQANLNLLNEAKKRKIKKFIYVYVLNAEKMHDLKIIQAKQKFVNELKKSGIDYCIIKANGFFADMSEFLGMAKKGTVYLFGKGNFKINPIHGQDLAEVCVNSIKKNEKEIEVGGTEILTHRQIAETAFNVLDKKVKITCIPIWVKNIILFLLRTFTSVKMYGSIEFFMTVLTMDMVAPKYGTHTLKNYFRESVNNGTPH